MSARGGRLRPTDGLRVASVGLRARPLRAALSALGTAAIVAVLGVSASSQAGLLAEIAQLGPNMLRRAGCGPVVPPGGAPPIR
jgi:putative ABC transport system permease protein